MGLSQRVVTWLQEQGHDATHFGDCALDVQRRVLYRAGQVIRLRRKVFQALTSLLTSRDRAVSKEELGQAVWPQLFIS